jgi:hypothetical protein
MVAKKCLPPPARGSSPPNHVLGNRRLSDLDAKLEEFADPWIAPEWVGDADVSDQLPNVQGHLSGGCHEAAISIANTSENLRGANG